MYYYEVKDLDADNSEKEYSDHCNALVDHQALVMMTKG